MRTWEELGFHYKGGWFFKRLPDGSVKIVKLKSAKITGKPVAEVIVDPESWASIVASVSKSGETGESWEKARRAHQQ